LAEQPSDAAASADRPTLAPADDSEEESYTSRLLRAKKKVWEQRND